MTGIIKLNRKNLFVTGVIIILLYLILNRLDYMTGTAQTNGRIIGVRSWLLSAKEGEMYSAPMVRFATDSRLVTFAGESNLNYKEGEIVPVIYKTSNPEKAHINTFLGLWLTPLLYCIFPLILLTAVYSFMNEKDRIIIHLEHFMFWRKKKKVTDSIFIKGLKNNRTPGIETGKDEKTDNPGRA